MVIDWMAVTLGVLFSRFGFRGIRSYLISVSSAGTPVAELKKTRGIEELILPQNTLTDEQRVAIEAKCRQAHLPCRRIQIQLSRVQEQQH